MNKNIVVLDTSVLLDEGRRVLHSFKSTDVVIPMTVVRELEGKRNSLDLGQPARSVIRELNKFSGDLKDGVPLGNGSTLRVELNHVKSPEGYPEPKSNDDRILNTAHKLMLECGEEVTLVTRDLSLSIAASLRGIKTMTEDSGPEVREFIDEMSTIEVHYEDLNDLFQYGRHKFDVDVPMNTGVVLRSGNQSAIALSKPEWVFELIKDQSILIPKAHPIMAKSKEQQVAIKLLGDESVRFTALGGTPGGGKSMLALAMGVKKVLAGEYSKIIVFRSQHETGDEKMGFLPGDVSEKMAPWEASVWDALESFLHKNEINQLKAKQQIEIQPISFIRGRTLDNAWIICDEMQNLSTSTALTVISRVGHNSRLVGTYDINQKDNTRVGKYNGIWEVVSKFHGNKLFGHVSMKKSERSALAEVASNLLNDF